MSAASSSSISFRPGETVAGKYVVERLLGEGGMGLVVLAMHTQLEQKVAIKFLKTEALQSGEAVARFVREARAAARIQSEHVVRVFDVATLETGEPYLVMEYLEGRDLDSEIRVRGPLPIDEAVTFVLEACDALAQAHKAGIIHRDLKPANLFLALQPDESVTVKILDFGISKLTPKPGGADAVSMTRTSAVMGSPLYMAPEQMRSTRQVDVRADVWSLGIVLYEALTGAPPFVADSLTEVCAMILTENPPAMSIRRPNLPPQLEAVVARCLEKLPEGRFADVADLAAALGPFAPPHARMLVDRVARVLRGGAGARSQQAFADTALGNLGSSSGSASGSSSGSSSGGVAGSSGSMPVAIAAAINSAGNQPALARPPTPPHPIPETLATFGRTDGHGTKPRSVLPYVIAALVAALAIVLVTILAVTKLGGDKAAARGGDTTAPTTPAVTAPVVTTAVTAPVVTAAVTAPVATDAPTATTVAVVPISPPVTPTTHAPTAAASTTAHTKPSTPATKPTVATGPTTKPTGTASKPAPLSTTGFGGRE
jgi:serine/threonine protein kinase